MTMPSPQSDPVSGSPAVTPEDGMTTREALDHTIQAYSRLEKRIHEIRRLREELEKAQAENERLRGDLQARWLSQGPTCYRCGNSWAARDQAERERDELRAALDALSASKPYAPRAEPLAKWIEENVAGSQVMRRDDGDWFVVT